MTQCTCAIGFSHSLFIDSSSNVWSFGGNQYGQLGLREVPKQNIPEKIHNLSEIISVSAGSHHSIFLDKNGNVFACGDNRHGQLGLGDFTHRIIAEKIKLFLKSSPSQLVYSIQCILMPTEVFLIVDSTYPGN